ncbi:M48 family metalloprotease [Acinetobacter qingfengensis]|nr:M48 family metalloprotease [Acinetobacter qingfengensis]KAA8735466.1 M48 family metalloprotease [Acinetobacter qingfengensis]
MSGTQLIRAEQPLNIDWSNIPAQKNPYLDVPVLGSSQGLISQQQEKEIGEKVLREVRLQLATIQDPWLETEIQQIFSGIYAQTGLGQPIAVVLIKDLQINAFAVPGGLFAINAGTIVSAKNIDQLAGVMAHEIAHVSQRHYSRSMESIKGQGILALVGLLAGLAVATQSADAGAAVMMGSQAAMIGKRLSYSRDQEREADRIGMQYMVLAGYDPNSMADFFEVMQRSSTQLSYLPEFWLTHPLTTSRMSEARLRARQFNFNSKPDYARQQRFELIKWRTLISSSNPNLTQLNIAAQNNSAAALALASYHIQQAQYQQAKKILDKIQPSEVQKNLYHLIWSDWYKSQNQFDQALVEIFSDYQIAPENKALAMQVAEIYILKNQPEQANQILNPLSTRFPRDVMVWQLLQRAANLQTGIIREINVLRYRAEVQFWNGQEVNAIKSLLQAQRLAKDQPALKARIDQRVAQMQDAHDLDS